MVQTQSDLHLAQTHRLRVGCTPPRPTGQVLPGNPDVVVGWRARGPSQQAARCVPPSPCCMYEDGIPRGRPHPPSHLVARLEAELRRNPKCLHADAANCSHQQHQTNQTTTPHRMGNRWGALHLTMGVFALRPPCGTPENRWCHQNQSCSSTRHQSSCHVQCWRSSPDRTLDPG